MSVDDPMRAALEAFRCEVVDLFDELAELVSSLPGQTGDDLRQAARAAMRLSHNLKGAAGAIGLRPLAELAHALEDVLNPLCAAANPPSPELTSAMENAVIELQRLADQKPHREMVVEPETAKLRDRLRQLAQAEGLAPPVVGMLAQATRLAPNVADATPSLPPDHDAPPSSQLGFDPMGEAHSMPGMDESVPGVSKLNGSRSKYLRVPAERIDALGGFLDDLVVLQGQLTGHARLLSQAMGQLEQELKDVMPSERGWGASLRNLHNLTRKRRESDASLARLVSDLALCVRRVRTVPLVGLGPQWRRVVRDTARQLGKQVRLDVLVGDTEIDKHVLDRLADPIVHILRNSVDHGIESRDERYALGKPAEGTIKITARMAGARIVIEVKDDGQGLEPHRIAAAAVKRGLISKEAAEILNSNEKLALLFRDGFSTAKTVSEISGRGVGLAAVKEAMDEIGGDYALESAGYGEGTTIQLSVPLNVLSTRGLLVTIDKVPYVLPVESVERALLIQSKDVQTVEGTRVIVPPESDPVPLLWLSAKGQNQRRSAKNEVLTIVVLARQRQCVGLVVDEVLEEQDYVTRRLPWNLRRVAGVNGAVVLPNGAVAVSLDIDHLLGSAAIQPARRTSSSASIGPPSIATSRGRLPILVVDDSLTSRTLERNILIAAGYDVDVAVDGLDGWERLQEKEYGLLVADVQMPRMDGLELTRKVREHPNFGQMPIVLVTSLGRREDIERGAAVGADEYVVKGQLENEKLLQAVERQLYGFGK